MDKDESGNAIARGSVLTEDASNNMIRLPEGKIAVLEGLTDFIVVDTQDVLLVVPKSKEQEIKQWVARVEKTFGSDLI
jgi:mannose-1-phosphate guanylyltransferase